MSGTKRTPRQEVRPIDAFLSGSRHLEHEALLWLIGRSILDPREADADDEPSTASICREWSDVELNQMGDMLARGLALEEIASLLNRDHRDVRDKVVEIGRGCR